MKEIFLISTLALLSVSGYSQTEKGSMFLGGQVGLNGSNYVFSDTLGKTTSKYINYILAPNFGQFIKDNLAIGIVVVAGEYSSTHINEHANPSIYKSTMKSSLMEYGVGLFIRPYTKIADHLFISFNGQFSYESQPGKDVYSTEDPNHVSPPDNPDIQYLRGNNVGVDIAPGLDYFLTPHLGFRVTFGDLYFNSFSQKNITLQDNNNNTSISYGLSLNISSFTFGMNYYF